MIITAVAVGTRGDVNPLAELGEELIRRGHEFSILTSEAFRPLIENKGVRYIKLDTDADQILVVSGGRIIERGDHKALMEMNGTYAHMVSLQS